jgi:hypothetical protein
MVYNIQLGSGGYIGWKILERSALKQKYVFSNTAQEKSITNYFSRKMENINNADDIISDYKMFSVMLRAFGLDDDIRSSFFIKKVLESDPDDPASFVNKLSDRRYLKMNQEMKFGKMDSTKDINVEFIIDRYNQRSFEKNIGSRYPEIEIALNAQRELPEIASSSLSENTKWYQILGSAPLRRVFEISYGLGSDFSTLPIDRQLKEIKSKFQQFTGTSSVSFLEKAHVVELVVQRYLLRSQIADISLNYSHANALTILRK